MKNLIGRFIYGSDAKSSALFVIGILVFVGLGCFGSGKSSSSKAVPAAYLGDWKGQDGSTISIRGDGKGDYKSGNTSVSGGSVEIDDAKNELSITFFGIGPSLKIDSPPSGDEMKLGGVTYKRNGGSSTTSKNTDSDDKNSSKDEKKSPLADKSPDTDKKSSLSSDGDIPSDDELQDLAKTTMLDFNDALQQEDFTDFFPTISKVWQRSSSPAKLKNSFQVFIDKKSDFSSIRTMSADFSGAPTSDDSYGYHEMILKGRYETKPLPTKFKLSYTQENGKWKLTGLSVDTTKN